MNRLGYAIHSPGARSGVHKTEIIIFKEGRRTYRPVTSASKCIAHTSLTETAKKVERLGWPSCHRLVDLRTVCLRQVRDSRAPLSYGSQLFIRQCFHNISWKHLCVLCHSLYLARPMAVPSFTFVCPEPSFTSVSYKNLTKLAVSPPLSPRHRLPSRPPTVIFRGLFPPTHTKISFYGSVSRAAMIVVHFHRVT